MRVLVKASSKTYPVIIQPKASLTFTFPKNAVLVTDTIVAKKYPKHVKRFNTVLTFPAGEQHKRLVVIEQLAEQLVKHGADRSTALVAFGGGVVGDMVGLLASLYMRGVSVYQMPTTLLAMVDASIGGKTGVDLTSGKNLLGTFHQPEAVIIDPTFVQDLPDEQFRTGMAEVIKHGVIDGGLFNWLERQQDKIQQRDLTTMHQLLIKNIKIKAGIVAADETERDARMVLNLGHTFGHALEQLSGYAIPHGEAVAMGLLYAATYSKTSDIDRMIELLTYFGLPTHLGKPFTAKQMVKVMLADKKASQHTLTLIVPKAIGNVVIKRKLAPSTIEQFIARYHAEQNN